MVQMILQYRFLSQSLISQSKNTFLFYTRYNRKLLIAQNDYLHQRNSQYSTYQAKQNTDPVYLTKDDLSLLHLNIKQELSTSLMDLNKCCHYYFDAQGKLFRPMTIILMGKACNIHHRKNHTLLEGQRRMAMIAEMIHTASLLHDDVIDDATTRRNKPSVNRVFSQKQTILAGDFILSRSSILLARLGNTKVVEYYSQIIEDLIKGELMQLVAKDDINERFNHYLLKTFRKTASLLAYSCQSAALLGGCSKSTEEIAYNFGKNLGIAFQLIDDALDFISTSEALGKPAGADLSLGLATAPVLFAAQKFPDLHALISRRFKHKEDVKLAFNYVKQSDGIAETFILARKYADEAVKNINKLHDSIEKEGLINLTRLVVDRTR